MIEQVELPGTGLRTTRLGFGTASLLRLDDARERRRLLVAALDAGIAHFDTAPIYGFGEAERTLGAALAGLRARVTIATKFGLAPGPAAALVRPLQGLARRVLRRVDRFRGPAPSAAPVLSASRDFRPVAVRASLERSLRALRTDYVDLFLAHEIGAADLPQAAELVDCLEALRRAGMVRAFGIATPLHVARGVVAARPALATVLQFDLDALRPFVFDDLGACATITHGALRVAGPELRQLVRDRPSQVAQWGATFGVDLADEQACSALLLRASMLGNPAGVVLMQTGSVRRLTANVVAACDRRLDVAARLLPTLPKGGTAT